MKKQTYIIIYTILLLLTAANASVAQVINNGIIKGTLLNEQQKAIPYGTAILRSAKDSIVCKAVLSNDDGAIIFTPIAKGTYFLEISIIGYVNSVKQNIQLTDATPEVDLGIIILSKTAGALKEVVVKAKMPFIEHKIDKTVVNVENSILSAGSTALEMLSKLPGVQVNENGQITLNGKTGVNIFIDGKSTYLSAEDLTNLLSAMPSANIQKIEIMTNPSAKYDASGSGGIIDIIKKKNKKEGINGSVTLSLGQGEYGKYNGGFTLNVKNKKYNLFFTNSYVNNKTLFGRAITNDILNLDNSLKTEQISNTKSIDKNKSFASTLGIDLYVSKKTILTVSGTISAALPRSTITSFLDELNNSRIETGSTLFQSTNKDKASDYRAGLHLEKQIDTLGKSVSVDIDYANYRNNPVQLINSKTVDTLNNLLNQVNTLLDGNRRLNIYAVKVDFNQSLKGDTRLEAGWKSSYVKSTNIYTFYDKSAGQNIIDSSQSSHTLNEENINALYVNLSRKYKRLTLEAGLRAEYIWNNVIELLSAKSIRQNYLQLFPSVFFDYTINDNNAINIKSGRRTDRASYREMIPFRRALSTTLFFKGNPDLKPQTSINNEITYSWKNELFCTIGYSFYKDYLRTLPFLDSNKITVTRIPSNIKGASSWNFDITYSKKIKSWWSTNTSISFFKKSFTGSANGFSLTNKGISSLYFNTDNNFIITNSLSAECNFEYNSKYQLANTIFGAYSVLSLGIKQQLLRRKAFVTLNMTNILQSEDQQVTDKYSSMNQYSFWSFYTRAVSISFSYRFGSGKISKINSGSGSAEEQKRSKSN